MDEVRARKRRLFALGRNSDIVKQAFISAEDK